MTAMAGDMTQLGVHQTELLLFYTLLQLIVIILAARGVGQLARKVGQPRVVGEIIAGLLLGPSLFGQLAPDISDYVFHSVSSDPITIISQIGLILLMFQIGMDFDFSHLRNWHNRKAVTLISFSSIFCPFTLGIIVGQASASYLAPDVDPTLYSLFVATAFSITAVPVLGRIMMEFDLTRTQVGTITISAAAINDVIGWLLLAIISALSIAQFSATETFYQLGVLLVYLGVCWWGVRRSLRWLCNRFEISQQRLPQNLTALILIMIFISGMCTYKIGIFAIFGGFMLGVLVHDQHRFVAAWKKTIGDFVIVFFLPVFFTYTGLRTDIQGLDTLTLWQWCGMMILFATLGKFGGSYLAARMAGLNSHQASTVGTLMNARGLMELIVLNIGYDLGVIPRNVFTMLVIMAVFSTVMAAPVLRGLLPRIGYLVPRGIDA
jgi:Kef-type K+ transport system membrane component KefB